MGSLWRTLRSRRVALWLIAGLSVYVGLVTLVPQQASAPDDHARWVQGGSVIVGAARALGADRAYTSPLFLILAGALALSTGACAWERSLKAARTWRSRGVVDERVRERLARRPDIVISTAADPADAAGQVAAALRSLGMRVRTGPSLHYAERGAWGLFGSPVFHWSMVLLVAVIALGQLSRWEGLLGVPEAGPVDEAAQTYRELSEGPLAMPHTGWAISLESIREQMRIGDVEYGVTPRIALRDGERVLAVQDVYPNNPLRHGPLLVHLSDHGLSVRIELVGPDGVSRGIDDGLIDFSEEATSGTWPVAFVLNDDEGEPIADVTVSVNARDRTGALPRLKPPGDVVIVDVVTAEGERRQWTPPVGGSVELGGGWTLVLRDFGYYARLSVVRDWSVAWVYGLLGVLSAGVCVALLVPYRSVWVGVQAGQEGGSVVTAAVSHYRRDPLFTASVSAALTGAVGTDASAPLREDVEGEG